MEKEKCSEACDWPNCTKEECVQKAIPHTDHRGEEGRETVAVDKPNRANEDFWDNGYFLYTAFDKAMQAYEQTLAKSQIPKRWAAGQEEAALWADLAHDLHEALEDVDPSGKYIGRILECLHDSPLIKELPNQSADHRGEESKDWKDFDSLMEEGAKGYSDPYAFKSGAKWAKRFLTTPESREESDYTKSIEGDYVFDRNKWQAIYAGDMLVITTRKTYSHE